MSAKLSTLSIKELRDELSLRGMDVSGTKLELIDRLEDAPEPMPIQCSNKRKLESGQAGLEKKTKTKEKAPILDFNADFGDGFTTLNLPRNRSYGSERDLGGDSSSSDEDDLDTSKPAPMLGARRFSIVEVVSAVQCKIEKELDEIKEDFDKQDDDEGFQREEEQEVLRLQTEAIHKAEFKCLFHVLLNTIGFILIDRESFINFYQEHIWTCIFGNFSTMPGCLNEVHNLTCEANETCASSGAEEQHSPSNWDYVQCHVCFDFSKYIILMLVVLLLVFAVWATESWFPHTRKFKKICSNIFDECRAGKPVLEESALMSSVLLLYDQINTRIPRHVTPPTHEEVHQLLEIFDDNHDGVMDKQEFVDFSVFLFYQVVNDVGLVLVIDLVLSPLYATLAHRVIKLAIGFSIPTVLLVPFAIRWLRSSILKHETQAKQ